jgi:hypothetical protein
VAVGERDVGLEGHVQARETARRTSSRARTRRTNMLAARGSAASVSVRCECGTPSCRTWLVVESEIYTRASTSRRYIVARGHHQAELERVVLKRRDYDLIEHRTSVRARP